MPRPGRGKRLRLMGRGNGDEATTLLGLRWWDRNTTEGGREPVSPLAGLVEG